MATDATLSNVLRSALQYAALGWKVIPLGDRAKVPRIKSWQTAASSDENQAVRWWDQWPAANVGVQLGERSGIVDAEADGPEEEEDYLRLFDGSPPVTCCFEASRGKHWLFRWRNDLPGGAVVKFGKLGIRLGNDAKGAQSVFPPSIHPDGKVYEWKVPPWEVEPAELPDTVVAKLWNLGGENTAELKTAESKPAKPEEHWYEIAKGVQAGSRNMTAAEFAGHLLNKLDVWDNSFLSLQWQLLQQWNRQNKPPMDEDELKRTFDSILSRERNKRTNATHEATFSRHVKRDPQTGVVVNQGWRLVTVTSIPPRYKLFSPLWKDYIVLDSAEMRAPEAICRAALDQARVWIPGNFSKTWRGDDKTTSLAAQLVENATEEEDAQEARRPFAIAEMLYSWLTSYPKHVGDGEEYDDRGLPCVNERGDRVFKFTEIYRQMARSEMKVKAHELTALIRSLGGVDFFPRIAGRNVRMKLIPKNGFSDLHERITNTINELTTQES